MGNMTEMCCDAIVEGLQGLKDSPQDLHRAYRSACSIIVQILKPFERLAARCSLKEGLLVNAVAHYGILQSRDAKA